MSDSFAGQDPSLSLDALKHWIGSGDRFEALEGGYGPLH